MFTVGATVERIEGAKASGKVQPVFFKKLIEAGPGNCRHPGSLGNITTGYKLELMEVVKFTFSFVNRPGW